jgi:hypothetical protein
MSFLAGALGNLGSRLLQAGGGYLLNKVASPVLSRVGSFFTNLFGGDQKAKSLGRGVMDRMFDTGLNAAMGGVRQFANSHWLKRKIPILAPAIGSAADHLQTRLRNGYDQLMNGGTGATAPASGAG